MKFIHVYDAMSFDGLVKNNFINEETGFKVQHNFSMADDIKFNTVAKKGSKLHSLIKEGNHPFYVDRLTGGVKYLPYNFDKALIAEYRDLLGDWFLGIQLHELGGNRRNDWNKVTKAMEGEPFPYDVAELKKRLFAPEATTPSGHPMYRLTQGTPEDYATRRATQTYEEVRDDLMGVIQKRMDETDGMIISCDSSAQICYLENKLGVKTFLPEVGGQIPHMRVQVALARGMAKANHKRWGTYYECWFLADGRYTQPVYNNHPFNEWHMAQSQFGDDFTSCGHNGGSSRLLQRRIYYYSLMSGAEFMGEEWGTNASYTNMDTFELSPYGLLKKEFIDFTLNHKNVKAKAPIAIVLPPDYFNVPIGSYNIGALGALHMAYCTINVTPAKAERFRKIHDLMKFIFKRVDQDIVGNEGHTLQNSRFGDLFDIIYSDCPEEAFRQYDLLIDADPDGVFTLKNGHKFPIIKNDNLEKIAHTINEVAKNVLPITVDSLHWVLSDDEHGHYLTVFNNEGNTRTVAKGDEIDHKADAVTTIHTKPGIDLHILYASSDNIRLEKKKDGEYSLFIPATEMVIFNY